MRRIEISEESITVLQYLSKPLQDELKAETYHQHLDHALFVFLFSQRSFTHLIAAFSITTLSTGDIVFESTQMSECMYTVCDGTCEYSHEICQGSGTGSLPTSGAAIHGPQCTEERRLTGIGFGDEAAIRVSKEIVGAHQWISEPAIWVQNWEHTGELVTTSLCQMMSIARDEFSRAALDHGHVSGLLREYGAAFLLHLNQTKSDVHDFTTLLFGDRDVLLSSGLVTREEFSMLLARHKNHSHGSHGIVSKAFKSMKLKSMKRSLVSRVGYSKAGSQSSVVPVS